MKISVVMPVFNEARTIKEIIKRVKDQPVEKEIIIVDDSSTDGTSEILRSLNDAQIRVYFHDKNKGKGAALRTGFQHTKGDIVITQDADLEYDPAEYGALVEPIKNGVADVVYGSRLWGGKPQRVHMFWHKAGNRLITFIANVLFNNTLTDIETGYKVFRKGVVESLKLKSKDFSIEPEITAKIFKKNYRVYELPISYYGRTYKEGKKITWRHGFGAIWALIKYRFVD
jgi:glycosyltransferase involved in cell wall biosynthesis